MPRVIELADHDTIALEDCLEGILADGFDPGDEASTDNAARWLRRLGNNRDFLAERLVDELKQKPEARNADSSYGAQVFMLGRPAGNIFLRANIWPALSDHAYRASGGTPFAYELPHDHNFDFLTVGYFGPGYWSDYYEYDYEAVHGWRGEPAGLRFVERARLEPGKLMHYRAHRDVHRQLPPDTMSVSLNVMHMEAHQPWLDQYRFDLEDGTVAGILTATASEVALKIACALDMDEAHDLAARFGRCHPSDRMRLAAFDARAGVAGTEAERDAIWAEAELSGSRMVAMEARGRRQLLDAAA